MSIQQRKRHSRWYERIFFVQLFKYFGRYVLKCLTRYLFLGERNLILLKLVLIRL